MAAGGGLYTRNSSRPPPVAVTTGVHNARSNRIPPHGVPLCTPGGTLPDRWCAREGPGHHLPVDNGDDSPAGPGRVVLVDPVEAVRRCGGRASVAQLRRLGVRPRRLSEAVRTGSLTRTRRGRYRLSALDAQLDVAIGLTATLSHRSAALHHGLAVASAPDPPEVTVRRNRRLSQEQQALVSATFRPARPAQG